MKNIQNKIIAGLVVILLVVIGVNLKYMGFIGEGTGFGAAGTGYTHYQTENFLQGFYAGTSGQFKVTNAGAITNSGALTQTGAVTISGAATLSGGATLSGANTLSGTNTLSGATTVSNTFTASATTTISGVTTVSGALTSSGGASFTNGKVQVQNGNTTSTIFIGKTSGSGYLPGCIALGDASSATGTIWYITGAAFTTDVNPTSTKPAICQ